MVFILRRGPGGCLNIRCHLTTIGIPMLKIRRSRDCLIFNMGITIPGKDGLYIETVPWFFIIGSCVQRRHPIVNLPHRGPGTHFTNGLFLYHTWVSNLGICRHVIMRPWSHMLIVRRKIVPSTAMKYFTFSLGKMLHSNIFWYIFKYLESTRHFIKDSYIY